MKRWKQLSIRKKIILLIIGIGLIPTAILFYFSSRQMKKISQQKQEYIMNQNFDIIFAAIEERMSRMQEVAAYLTADDSVESLFYQEFEKKHLKKKCDCIIRLKLLAGNIWRQVVWMKFLSI